MSYIVTNPAVDAPVPVVPEDDVNLLDLLDVVLDSSWLIAAVVTVMLALGMAYAFLAIPIYEANTLIQVEESSASGGAAKSLLGDAANMFDIRTPATAEIEILRSRLVIGQAVNNLQLALIATPKYTPLVGNWLARRATGPSTPGFLGMSGYVSGNESIRVAAFDVPTVFEGGRFSVVLTPNGYRLQSPKGENLGEGKLGQVFSFVVGGQKGRLLVAETVGKPGAEFYLVRASNLVVIEGLQKKLRITEQGKQSGVISVSLQGPDPTGIARVLNEMGAIYVRQNIDRKSAEAEKTLGFLGSQLPLLRQQLDESETKFNQFRNQRGLYDLDTEAKHVLDQAVKLQSSLLELKQKRQELASRFTDQHPSIQTIDGQIKSVNVEINALNARVKVYPSVEQDLLRLTRDVKVNSELYVNLLNSSQQLRLVKEGKVGNVRIVDNAAVPEQRIKPQRFLAVVMAGILGLLAGLVIVFMRNSLRPGIKDPADIEQSLGLNVFASVPYSNAQELQAKAIKSKTKGSHLLALVAPKEPAVEALRSLRTALQFAMLDATNNIVLFIGPTPGIGKSFVSANFACVLAAAGKKVLLIDADLRRGHINQYFGLGRSRGLSEVISGRIKLEDAVQKQVVPNLDFLSTGKLPPNPAELLMMPKTKVILHQLAQCYDFVIIDTAPVLVASDTAILASLAGAVFMVARANVTSLGEMQASIKQLGQSGVQIKGVIFNGIDLRKRLYGYGMGYKYSSYRHINYKY
jgi:tyrosine-protein kinase Etk/Wzc